MTKKLLLTLLISAITFAATGQSQKNWMSVSVGAAVPFNDFKDNLLTDTVLYGGFAQTGLALNLTYTYQLVRSFGITAIFMGNSNKTDVNAMEKELQRYIKENSEISDFTCSGTIGNWKTGMLLVGTNINFGEREFQVEIRGLLGVGVGFSPKHNYTITPDQGVLTKQNIIFKQQSDNALAFAWNIGGGFKYRFDRIFVRLNVDYSATNLEYKNINIQLSNPSEDNVRDYINRKSKMNVQTDIMQITGGVGYIF